MFSMPLAVVLTAFIICLTAYKAFLAWLSTKSIPVAAEDKERREIKEAVEKLKTQVNGLILSR